MRLSAIIITSCILGFSQYANADSIIKRMDHQATQIEQLHQQILALQNDDAVNANSDGEKVFTFSSYGSVVYASREVFKNVQYR